MYHFLGAKNDPSIQNWKKHHIFSAWTTPRKIKELLKYKQKINRTQII